MVQRSEGFTVTATESFVLALLQKQKSCLIVEQDFIYEGSVLVLQPITALHIVVATDEAFNYTATTAVNTVTTVCF